MNTTHYRPDKTMETLNYKHSGNSGDVLYALSCIKKGYDVTGKKANLFLWLDCPAWYYEGAKHPIFDGSGKNVMLNKYMYNMVKPLLEAQPYIASVQEYKGEEIHINLDLIRSSEVNMPYGDIRKWYGYVYYDIMPDISQQCIWVPETVTVTDWEVRTRKLEEKYLAPKFQPYILVNRTQRYQNTRISYQFLQHLELPVIFAGSDEEFALFLREVPGAVRLQAEDFLHLAWWIREAKVFIGNQSMNFAIAEQMKTRRIMEVCNYAPNVIPVGGEGYDFYTQSAFEGYVKMMIK